jgi:hypothetical protein
MKVCSGGQAFPQNTITDTPGMSVFAYATIHIAAAMVASSEAMIGAQEAAESTGSSVGVAVGVSAATIAAAVTETIARMESGALSVPQGVLRGLPGGQAS